MVDTYLEIIKKYSEEEFSEEDILSIYKELNKFNNYVYDFVLNYYNYIHRIRDYDTGLFLSMLEAHIITDIADNPGINASDLAKKWDRTPAAISQIINKLEKEDILERKISKKDRKYINLYITEKGKQYDFAHKKYDVYSIIRTNRELLKKFTPEEIKTSRRFMDEYRKIIMDE